MNKLLSICIPTYNRISQVTEVIDSLLLLKRDDFEIVITDNCSTDDTSKIICSYSDPRVRYCLNEKPLAPFLNMIHSLFNANGKYALYCNDRDLIHADRLPDLLNVLADGEYAYIHGPAASQRPTNELLIYEKGFDSLMHHDCIHHPTGMIFNRLLMSEFLKESDYEQYVPYVNTYDFLRIDLMAYGLSAVYAGGYWSSRPSEYISTHKSGTAKRDISALYFSPETREKMFYGITEHIMHHKGFHFSDDQRIKMMRKIDRDFTLLFSKYKACMADPNETAHYGIKTSFIPVFSILHHYNVFFNRSQKWILESIKRGELLNDRKKHRAKYRMMVLTSCVKIDCIQIYRAIMKITH